MRDYVSSPKPTPPNQRRPQSQESLGSILESLEPRLLLSAGLPVSSAPLGTDGPSAYVTTLAGDASPQVTPTVVATINGAVSKIVVSGSLAFAFGTGGVQIASLADPHNPQVVAPITPVSRATAVVVSGNTLYIGESDGTVEVFNIAVAANPVPLGSFKIELSGLNSIQGMAFLDNGSGTSPKRLYVACLGDGVKVLDVTTPASPTLLGTIKRPGELTFDVAIVGTGKNGWAQNALAVISNNNVYLLNASNPNQPTTGSFNTYNAPYNLYADGFKLYVTDSAGLHLVNATSFTHPRAVGSVAADSTDQPSMFNASATGQLAYLTHVGYGVTIIDIGAIGGPASIGVYLNADARGIAAYGTTLYVACNDGTWKAVDTGVTRDLTVTGISADPLYIRPGKSFAIDGNINNLGDLTVLANQGISVKAFLSDDATLSPLDIQLTPIAVEKSGIAPQADLDKTWSFKVPSIMQTGAYRLILKLENGGAADDDLTNDTWVSPDDFVNVLRGKPPITVVLNEADDSGVSDDNVTNTPSVLFSGTTRADCTVVLKRGRTVLGTTTSAADGSYSFADIALVSGTNSLTVAVTDKAGNYATLSRKIVLDTAVAASSLKLDRSSDSGKKGDFLTNLSPVKLTGKTEKGSTVDLQVNNVTVATTTASSRGTFSFTAVAMSPGDNTVTVNITDAAGNTTSVTQTIKLDQSALAPTLVLAPASDTDPAGDGITNLSKVQLNGTAESYSKVYLQVLRNTKYVTVATATAAADGTVVFPKVTLKPGDNTFTAIATDLAGNTAAMLSNLIVTYQ